jgi:D-arabinose 1-dehydrogenase-like Zn-dependent alcohol dehydrogenase
MLGLYAVGEAMETDPGNVFSMSQINQAFDHLENGKARYRIVLENDFSV